MNRLQAEWQRLYLPPAAAGAAADSAAAGLATADGRTRALVLAVAARTAWPGVLAVWHGVQADLQWPAPAIAVAGSDGYQLWFSLAAPVPARAALALLEHLRRRYLPELALETVATFPPDPAAARSASRPPLLPPQEIAPGRWSAFVAPDLGALFADEPWLDLAPSADAQADLLSRLHVVPPADWQRACERLAAAPAAQPAQPVAAPESRPAGADAPTAQAGAAIDHEDPRRFLLAVMNDPAVDLHLRIEAAKALLPCSAGPRAG